MAKGWLLAIAMVTTSALAEPVDNCATMLGSISVELRHARALPPGTRTTFVCPRDTSALIGASKQRITNSLGAPDAVVGGVPSTAGAGVPVEAEGVVDGNSVATTWSYYFASAHSQELDPGIPELVFSFDIHQQVSAVSCQRTR